MSKKDKEKAIEQLKEREPTDEHKQQAQALADQQNASGTVVTKYQLCGSYCSGCPHGPYAWVVDDDGWHYLGKVGASNGEANAETNTSTTTDTGPVLDEVAADVLDNIDERDGIRTKMDIEVEDGELVAQSNKGNKSLVGVADGYDSEESRLDLDIAAYQQPKTKERARGSTDIEPGDIVKHKKWSHSGKTGSTDYAIYDGEQLVEISKDEAREITFRRNKDVTGDVVVDNKDHFGVDNTRSGDGWVQRIHDYDPDEYTYNWDSDFENDPISGYEEGDVVRTSKDDFYVVEDGELVEVDEDEAKEAAREN